MKNTKIVSLILSVGMFFSSVSCEEFLDVNKDPNNPTDVSEALLLTGILANFSYEVVGGYPVRVTNTWVKQTTYNAVLPSYDNYQVTENDVNNLWTFYSYPQIMHNCKVLAEKAEASSALNYAAIAKIIWAWNMSIVTDLWGNAPFSEALQPDEFPKPAYDSQESIYQALQNMLDDAISDIDATEKNAAITPGADDFIYKGVMSKWRKVAYTLKARFYLRLTYAPGHTPATQAQLALDAIDDGLASSADNAEYPYLEDAGQENPWFQYAIDGKWDNNTQISANYIDLLDSLGDPRMHSQAELVANAYAGHENGTAAEGDLSAIGSRYSSADAPLTFMTYAEAEFIRAEAQFLLNNTPDAEAALKRGIKASIDYEKDAIVKRIDKIMTDTLLDLSINDEQIFIVGQDQMGEDSVYLNPAFNATTASGIVQWAEDDYVQVNGSLGGTPEQNYRRIMEQKYIADFLQFETYNDWRRTGYPEVFIVPQPYPDNLTTVPLRFPYPSAELQYNATNVNAEGLPVGFRSLGSKVWWNSCDDCCTICGEK